MRILSLLLALVASAIFFSCTSDPVPSPPDNGGSEIYKVVVIDSNYRDTMYIADLAYDAQQRISSITVTSRQVDYPDALVTFHYNNTADTLAASMKVAGGNYARTKYFQYDAQGRVVYDTAVADPASVAGGNKNEAYRYVFSGNQVIAYHTLYLNGQPTVAETRDTAFRYLTVANGNFTRIKDSTSFGVNTADITYGANPSYRTKGILRWPNDFNSFWLPEFNLDISFATDIRRIDYAYVAHVNSSSSTGAQAFQDLEYYSNGLVKKMDEYGASSLTGLPGQLYKDRRFWYFLR